MNGNKYIYNFTNTWQGGRGDIGESKSKCLYFTPEGKGKVTVVFNGGAGRDMYISQNGKTVTGTATGEDVAFGMEISDTENPVYVYGAGSNKNLYAIIVEYYGEDETENIGMTYAEGNVLINSNIEMSAKLIHVSYNGDNVSAVSISNAELINGEIVVPVEAANGDKFMLWDSVQGMKTLCNAETVNIEDKDTVVQSIEWNGGTYELTKNSITGETKVWHVIADNIKSDLQTDIFYKQDGISHRYGDKYKINCLVTYKGRMYAGCDNGIIIMFTKCAKCYQIFKKYAIDIKSMTISAGRMYVSDGERELNMNMDIFGGGTIEPEEAKLMLSKGAVLIDVRTTEEFDEDCATNSVNIPLDEIENGLSEYDKDVVIIFVCKAGTRAGQALEKAKSLGFENIYNAGSYENFK